MSSLDWVPELAAALDELVPLDDGSSATWDDVVARVNRRRRLRPWQSRPRRGLRLAIVVALLLLLLTGVATATYLLVWGNGGIALGGGSVRLLVVNPNGLGLHAVARCPARSPSCAIFAPSWSPDGMQVAFLRGRFPGGGGRSHFFLNVAAADGAGVRRLVSCGTCGVFGGGRPGWSPDGKWIAFSRDAVRQESLWVVAANGGRPHRLTDCRAPCADFQPGWSPDGHRLVFARSTRVPGASGIYTIRSNGSRLTRIASGWGDPVWSPDGRRIAFDKRDGIAVMNTDGSHVHVLIHGTSPGVPSWSPDGRKLVFFKTPGRRGHFRAEVWTMNADGSGKERLDRSGCCVGDWAPPIWSPDGRMIAFSADSAGGTFVINADGTGLRRVSPIAYEDLSWQRTPKGEH